MAQKPSPFEHPEVGPVFFAVMNTLVTESDRGAVLVGASVVDTYLRKLFEQVAPESMSRKTLRGLLKYPGALSTLAAKVDVGFATGLIGEELHAAIHVLRKIRNDLAHSPESFLLEHHQQAIRDMYDLGPGVPSSINEIANRTVVQTFLQNYEELRAAKGTDGVTENPGEILDRVRQMPEVMKTLQEKAHRYEFGIGVGLICALLVASREAAQARPPAKQPWIVAGQKAREDK